MRTLRQAIVDAQGFRSPARDDTERRQKAWAIAEFQRTTGFDDDVLNTPVDVIAEAVSYYLGTSAISVPENVECRMCNGRKVVGFDALGFPRTSPCPDCTPENVDSP